MSYFICPVCKSPLLQNKTYYQCGNGHRYDRAKSGYVNLLMSQNKKAKRHGDDKAMVMARTRFLEGGYYQCLLDMLLDVAGRYAEEGCAFLDAGCGEGFFSGHIRQALAAQGRSLSLIGMDISKEAVKAFAKREPDAESAVASTFNLPVKTESCHIAMSAFAPFAPAEICRVLVPGGIFIKAYPLEKHLLSLKKLAYDQVYENKLPAETLPGFIMEERRTAKSVIRLNSTQAIADLFMMTPYFYKTSRVGQEKLLATAQLTTEIEFGVDVYRRQAIL